MVTVTTMDWRAVLAFLLFYPGCFSFIVGLVMLIVGRWTKKRGIWIAGLILMPISLAMVGIGVAISLLLMSD